MAPPRVAPRVATCAESEREGLRDWQEKLNYRAYDGGRRCGLLSYVADCALRGEPSETLRHQRAQAYRDSVDQIGKSDSHGTGCSYAGSRNQQSSTSCDEPSQHMGAVCRMRSS